MLKRAFALKICDAMNKTKKKIMKYGLFDCMSVSQRCNDSLSVRVTVCMCVRARCCVYVYRITHKKAGYVNDVFQR